MVFILVLEDNDLENIKGSWEGGVQKQWVNKESSSRTNDQDLLALTNACVKCTAFTMIDYTNSTLYFSLSLSFPLLL